MTGSLRDRVEKKDPGNSRKATALGGEFFAHEKGRKASRVE